jgi:arachidonate 15-lipoxygenase
LLAFIEKGFENFTLGKTFDNIKEVIMLFDYEARKHPSLPQNDSPKEQEGREKQLAKAKTVYIWDDHIANVEGVPMSKDVPPDDKPTLSWFTRVIDVALQIVENTLANFIEGDERLVELKKIKSELERIRDAHKNREPPPITSWIPGILKKEEQLISLDSITAYEQLGKLQDLVMKNYPAAEKTASLPGLAPYKELFNTIKLQPIAEDFRDDSVFAYYRVGGPNPMLIKLMTEIPPNFPVSEEGYRSVLPGDSLAQALIEKRLFMLDYKELQLLVDNTGFYDGLPKQLFAPLALFARPKDSQDLVPVAIQRTQNADAWPIEYATRDEKGEKYWQWQTAKSIVQIAEGNYHELFVHLARTHLLVEAFAVSTHRSLSEMHPVNILLLPHFEGTLFINNSAANSLVAPGGPIDELFAAKISTTQQSAGSDRLKYDFYENMLPNNLKKRGVEDSAVLPNYPYRDDALLVWNAIREWVTEYINIYYENDQAVTGDTELAAWTADLIGEGKVKGFKPIISKEQLISVLTMVIFTGSAQHAAVNFPQSSIMTYAPAISGSVWGEKNPTGRTEQNWVQLLPPIKLAAKQLNILHLLGGVYYRPLGDYRSNRFPYPEWFKDKKIIGKGQALDRFREALGTVEKVIAMKNQSRSPQYCYLLPSQIPMSINI